MVMVAFSAACIGSHGHALLGRCYWFSAAPTTDSKRVQCSMSAGPKAPLLWHIMKHNNYNLDTVDATVLFEEQLE